MKNFKILFVFVMLFSACSKNDNDSESCTDPASPTATSDSPVTYGENLHLYASSVSGASGYSWVGPNGFTSSDQNPIIGTASAANSGTYYVKAISGNCESAAASVVVTVDTTLPCAPFTNQVNLSGVPAVALGFVHGALDNSLNQYKITANGSNGDVYVYFGRPTQPVAGVYELKASSSFLTEHQAAVTVTTSPSYWQNSSGLLYVSVNSGKVSATFCDIPFSESTFGWNTTAFGNITEQ